MPSCIANRLSAACAPRWQSWLMAFALAFVVSKALGWRMFFA
jgi:hypothetical protein